MNQYFLNTFLLAFLVFSIMFLKEPRAVEKDSCWLRHTIDNTSQGADGVRLMDVNGDRLLDFATGWEEGGVIRLYLNPGADKADSIWPSVTVGNVGSPEDAVFVDLDRDGAIDVVSCCEGKVKTVWVHWAPSDPTRYLDPAAWKTEPFPQTKGSQAWMFCLPMRIGDRDRMDLVIGAKNDGAQIGWLEAPANPRVLTDWKWRPLYEAGWIMSLIPFDMDDDGDLDIVASDRRGPHSGCLWLEHPNNRLVKNKPWKEHRIGTEGKEIMFITVTDLDRDGLTDILTAVKKIGLIYYRRTNKEPAAWEEHTISFPPNAGTPKAVKTGDIDLDGKVDIVFTCEHAEEKSGVMWMSYPNTVIDPVWNAHDISGLEGVKYDLVELIDLDHDGDLDALTCEERDNLGVIWYENPTRN